jgi:surfeit locus 1 family protein
MVGVFPLPSRPSRTIDTPANTSAATITKNANAMRYFMRLDYRGWTTAGMVVLLAAVSCAGLGLRLGMWQLDRAAQKRSLQATLDSRSQMPPLAGIDLALTAAGAAEQWQRRVTLSGTWLSDATVYLENRQMNGRPGFYVLTPLRLAPPASQPHGPAADTMVMVQRGWVVRDNNDRTRLPPLPASPGVVMIEGRVAPPPARLYEFSGQEQGPIRQNLTLEAYGRELGLSLRPFTVLQTDAPGAPADGLSRAWAPPATDVQKHHGYAFQWFALSALITGLYVWFQLLRPRRLRDRAR